MTSRCTQSRVGAITTEKKSMRLREELREELPKQELRKQDFHYDEKPVNEMRTDLQSNSIKTTVDSKGELTLKILSRIQTVGGLPTEL